MFLITREHTNCQHTNCQYAGQIDVLVLMDRDDISRVIMYDPFHLPLDGLPVSVDQIRSIGIGFADATDMETIVAMVKDGKVKEAFAFVARGATERPGDDAGITDILGEPDA